MAFKPLLASATALALLSTPALADCPIKVGVLHSLSGSMAISETTLRDVMLMLIEQQNAAGGLLGCQIEPVVVEPRRIRVGKGDVSAMAGGRLRVSGSRECGACRWARGGPRARHFMW